MAPPAFLNRLQAIVLIGFMAGPSRRRRKRGYQDRTRHGRTDPRSPIAIIQVTTVVLIALIAVSRKFVILDTATTEATKIAALAAALLALGAVYWVLRERDESPLELTSEAHLTRNRRREEPP